MRQDPNEPTTPTIDPPEDRPNPEDHPDMGLPGVDDHGPQVDPQDDLPQRLGERIGQGPSGLASGEPDLLPNVEVPTAQM